MAEGIYKITEQFEKALCDYTCAPYAVAVDNCSNALFLSLLYEGVKGKVVKIPARTYPSVPCSIIHAGGIVQFYPMAKKVLTGAYNLEGTSTWDSALRFTHNMYIPMSFMCLSFTGPKKHLKLGKGGAILTDDREAYEWFKRARFSGRREKDYHLDTFDMLGFNFYMMPEIATRGLLLIQQFYDVEGEPIHNADLTIPYPDLSKSEAYEHRDV
jgi:dTDP-4-amino-4,6-dideoxygalactose transaminase